MTPTHFRAARGALDWTLQQLADAAGVSLSTVRDFEKGRRQPTPKNMQAMAAALADAGLVMLVGEGQHGVCWVPKEAKEGRLR